MVAQAKAEQGLANWIALELRHLVPEMGSQFFGGIWHDLARLGIVFQGCLAQFLITLCCTRCADGVQMSKVCPATFGVLSGAHGKKHEKQ